MPYKALTYVVLGETKYSPGDVIDEGAFDDAGQTAEDIELLTDGGAISDDMDAEVHPDHLAPAGVDAPDGSDTHVISEDGGSVDDHS